MYFWSIFGTILKKHFKIIFSCVKMTVIDFWVCSKAKIIFDWTEAAHARGKRLRRVRVFKIVQDEALKTAAVIVVCNSSCNFTTKRRHSLKITFYCDPLVNKNNNTSDWIFKFGATHKGIGLLEISSDF